MSLRAYIEEHTLQFIGAFKLLKGVLLLAAGIGTLHLLHRDIAAEVERWLDASPLDLSNQYVQQLLAHLSNLDEKHLKELSIGSLFYAVVFLTEGTGLWLGKRWAEYFTILATSSFLPLEVYELYRRFTAPRLSLLLLNLAIVAYLVFDLRSRTERDHQQEETGSSVRPTARPATRPST